MCFGIFEANTWLLLFLRWKDACISFSVEQLSAAISVLWYPVHPLLFQVQMTFVVPVNFFVCLLVFLIASGGLLPLLFLRVHPKIQSLYYMGTKNTLI